MQSSADNERRRRKMRPGDWLNAAVILVIGALLGIAANGVMRLATTDFWPSAVFTVLVFAGAFAVVLMLEKLVDGFFPNRIRPAQKERGFAARPVELLLSLPVGAAIGFVLGWLDLATPLLELLP